MSTSSNLITSVIVNEIFNRKNSFDDLSTSEHINIGSNKVFASIVKKNPCANSVYNLCKTEHKAERGVHKTKAFMDFIETTYTDFSIESNDVQYSSPVSVMKIKQNPFVQNKFGVKKLLYTSEKDNSRASASTIFNSQTLSEDKLSSLNKLDFSRNSNFSGSGIHTKVSASRITPKTSYSYSVKSIGKIK